MIDLSRGDLSGAFLNGANLSGVNLSGVNLSGADLRETFLRGANLRGANLRGADLGEANLSGAFLNEANLSGADLSGVDLRGANLGLADLNGANLNGADLSTTKLGWTIFAFTDFSTTKGLDACIHEGPSSIDYHTLMQSGSLPLNFLRGSGLQEVYIDYLPSLLNQPIKYYSCFISYSSKDEEFTRRLYADLQEQGVRCWYAPENMKIDDKIRARIDEVIRLHEKLLIVLSDQSVASDWVEKEVDTAFEKERMNKETVLFPI